MYIPRCLLGGLLFLLCVPAVGAAQQPVLTEVEVEVRAAFDAYLEATRMLAVDAIVSHYADDPRFLWLEDGEVRYRSRAEVRGALEGLASGVTAVDLSVGSVEVVALGPNAAHVVASFEETLHFRAADPYSFAGVFSIAMIRTDEGWRFLQGHSSTLDPEMPEAGAWTPRERERARSRTPSPPPAWHRMLTRTPSAATHRGRGPYPGSSTRSPGP